MQEGPSFKGQPQIRLLLTYVKNAITEPWQQLPFVLMLFAAEASCILVHPESPHYLTITRYLLKGPSMDLEVCCPLTCPFKVRHLQIQLVASDYSVGKDTSKFVFIIFIDP